MWEKAKEFYKRPFDSENMDAFDWFLFFGLVLVIFALWGLIFRHIRGEG